MNHNRTVLKLIFFFGIILCISGCANDSGPIFGEIQVADISEDAIGTWARVSANDNGMTEKDLIEFYEESIIGAGHVYFTIDFGDGTGYVFHGLQIDTYYYGPINELGQNEEIWGMGQLKNGIHTYSEAISVPDLETVGEYRAWAETVDVELEFLFSLGEIEDYFNAQALQVIAFEGQTLFISATHTHEEEEWIETIETESKAFGEIQVFRMTNNGIKGVVVANEALMTEEDLIEFYEEYISEANYHQFFIEFENDIRFDFSAVIGNQYFSYKVDDEGNQLETLGLGEIANGVHTFTRAFPVPEFGTVAQYKAWANEVGVELRFLVESNEGEEELLDVTDVIEGTIIEISDDLVYEGFPLEILISLPE